MKLPIIRKIQKEDLGSDAPEWTTQLLSPLNQFIEQVGLAITGRLTFGDNLAGSFLTQDFIHNVENTISPRDTRKVVGVTPIFSDADVIAGFNWAQKVDGNIGVKILFQSGGTTTANVKLLLLFS